MKITYKFVKEKNIRKNVSAKEIRIKFCGKIFRLYDYLNIFAEEEIKVDYDYDYD